MPNAKTGAKSCKLKDGSSDILVPPSPGGNIPTCVSSCQNSGHFAVGVVGLLQKATRWGDPPHPPRHNAPPYIDELHTHIHTAKQDTLFNSRNRVHNAPAHRAQNAH